MVDALTHTNGATTSQMERAYFEQVGKELEEERFSSFCRDIAIIGNALHVPLPPCACGSPTSISNLEFDFEAMRPSEDVAMRPKRAQCEILELPENVLHYIGSEFFAPLSWLCFASVCKHFHSTWNDPHLWMRAHSKFCPSMEFKMPSLTPEVAKWSCLRHLNLSKWMSEVVRNYLQKNQHCNAERKFVCFADSEDLSEQQTSRLASCENSKDSDYLPSSIRQQVADLNLCSYGRPFESHGDGWKYFEGVRVGKSFFIVKALYRESSAELSIDLYHTGTSGIVRLSASALEGAPAS